MYHWTRLLKSIGHQTLLVPFRELTQYGSVFNVTEHDLHEAKAAANAMSVEEVKAVRLHSSLRDTMMLTMLEVDDQRSKNAQQ